MPVTRAGVGTSVSAGEIATGAVTTDKLAANAVTAAKVAADVATQAELDAVAAAAINTSSPVALTQTYATADATHAALTAAALTSNGASANNALVDVATAGIADPAKINANFDDVADEVNKLLADLTDVKQFVNSIADQLQAKGLAS